MTLNAERVTFTKKKKTVACPVPLAPLADTHAHLLSFWGKKCPRRSCAPKPRASTCW
ncbi:MAG: hypothetical protein ACLRM9_07435 [Collinsella aerofaciens]